MKTLASFLLATALLSAGPLRAELSPEAQTALTKLQSQDVDERTAAVEALAPLGAAVVPALCALRGDEDRTVDLWAQRALEAVCHLAATPGNTARQEVADALVTQLAVPRAPALGEHLLLMLSFVGGDAQAAALKPWLLRGELQEPARRCLVRLPGKAATQVLTDALDGASPELRVALLTALAERGDLGALDRVRQCLKDPSSQVRATALFALSRLPAADSEPLLLAQLTAADAAERQAAQEAYLRLADALLDAGDKVTPGQMYRRVSQRGALPLPVRAAGLLGLARTGGADSLSLLLTSLSDKEPRIRLAARQALIDLDAQGVAKEVALRLPEAAPEFRVELLDVLGLRGRPEATPVLVAALKDPDAAVVSAALDGIGRLADPTAAPALVLQVKQNEAVRYGAVSVLGRLPGAEATQAILEGLAGAPAEVRALLLGALKRRDPKLVTAVLLDALADQDEGVRQAGEDALATLPPDAVRGPAVARLDNSPTVARASLVRVLGRAPEPGLLLTFLSAAKSPDEALALAGVEALGRLGDESTAGLLANLAENGSEPLKAPAVRSYIQVGDKLQTADEAGALAIYRKALKLAPTDEERKLALNGLGEVGSPESLPDLLPCLEAGPLRAQAAAALFPVSEKLVEAGDRAGATKLLLQVVKYSTDRTVLNPALAKLRDLGTIVDLAADAGFVANWWVCGPVGKRGDLKAADVLDPAQPVDLVGKLTVGETDFPWRYALVQDPLGMLDLTAAVAQQDNVGCYAYAELTSPTAQPVLLKVGSDDDFVCWLNGVRAGEYLGDRAWGVDQTTLEVTLNPGVNTLLVKVLNGGGGWACSVRVTDRNGEPLRLRQLTNKDLLAVSGLVTDWWVVGPLSTRQALLNHDLLDPAAEVDTVKPVADGDTVCAWKYAPVTDPAGMLDLQATLARKNDVGSYAYAEITSPAEQPAVIKLGSDDDFVCWLNGKQVVECHDPRPWAPDQNSAEVTLKAGRNTLLLKVLNGGGNWACSARFTDRDGKPLKLGEKTGGE